VLVAIKGTVLCCRAMPKKTDGEKGGAWIFRDIPRDLMIRAKIAAAHEETTIKALVVEALEKKIQEIEKKHGLHKTK
jgi:hypothetical protein